MRQLQCEACQDMRMRVAWIFIVLAQQAMKQGHRPTVLHMPQCRAEILEQRIDYLNELSS